MLKTPIIVSEWAHVSNSKPSPSQKEEARKKQEFIHGLTGWNQLVRHNKQYHRKVLFSSFHLNGHTMGFHSPQTSKKLEPP